MARRPLRQITIPCRGNPPFFFAIQRNFLLWKKKKLFLRTPRNEGGTGPPPKDFFVRVAFPGAGAARAASQMPDAAARQPARPQRAGTAGSFPLPWRGDQTALRGRFFCRPRAMPISPSGTSLVMTEPAPISAPSPTRTGATRAVLLPMKAPSPMVVLNLCLPS